MKERYEVRQFIKHNGNKRLEMVSSKKTLEEAEKLYSFLCKYHSDVYFEIVKISYEGDALRDRLLAALHDDVHELGELDIAVLRIRQDFAFGNFATTWHGYLSMLQLAPL